MEKKPKITKEQESVLNDESKNLIVSASAGSGKTFVMIEKLIDIICNKRVPISRLLILTFTKAGAGEMKARLQNAILSKEPTEFLLDQIDDIPLSDISTIDSFCEKLIKQNINKLDIDENFAILEENESKKLKYSAFEKAFDIFSDRDDFENIYFAFKKNKMQIFEMLCYFQNFFNSSFNKSELVKAFVQNELVLCNDSEKYLNTYLKKTLKDCEDEISNLFDLPDVYENYKNSLLSLFKTTLSDDLIDNFDKINSIAMPVMPRNKIKDVQAKNKLALAKDRLKDLQKFTAKYQGLTIELKENLFEKNAGVYIDFYLEYENQYQALKKNKSLLDFADLEFFAKQLLEDDEIMKSLQEKYDYIFVDEYQDTNYLQEAIIKPIAKNGRFFAVGDPKQGIYGFRNASMEIMNRDIEEFSNQAGSEALFLKGNFRSCGGVLEFVNKIFGQIMTKEDVGIDYKQTSMLESLGEFKDDKIAPVKVFIVGKKEEDQKHEGVYSVKDEPMLLNEKSQDEAKLIASQIEEFLGKEIYDSKLEKFRKVTEDDIAVLFRSRDNVMEETVKYLQEKNFNVNADIKQKLLDDQNIRILLALFKIILNFEDDIALASVMNSWIGSFSLEELADLALANNDKTLHEIVKESKTDKIADFRGKIDSFYFNTQVLGVSEALNKLFSQNNFFAFVNKLPTKNLSKNNITYLFEIIKGGQYDNNLAGLVEFLENIETETPLSSAVGKAITVCTIHASKGLEWPIVIVAGGGQNLHKSYRNSYILSNKYGLGLHLFDYDEGKTVPSLQFSAALLEQKRKEFVDEIMIFYVALTRAKNHLVVTGKKDISKINYSKNIFDYKDYLDIICNVFGENFVSNLLGQKYIKTQNFEFYLPEEIMDICGHSDKVKTDITKIKDIENYIDFVYPDFSISQMSYKNSVTSMLSLNQKENEFVEYGENRDNAIERGIAYHEALRKIDFSKINTQEDVEEIDNILPEEQSKLVNKKILFKNIELIKSKISGQVFKEKQFIMQASLREIGAFNSDEKVIIQGTCDLFSKGEKTVLIDYKFTSLFDSEKIKEKYQKQIDLYSLAIEKAFGVRVDERYLLSLKNAQLIKL